jgi:gluconolactonase
VTIWFFFGRPSGSNSCWLPGKLCHDINKTMNLTQGKSPMRTLRILLLVSLSTGIAFAQQTKPIPGIGPAGEIVKLHTGFKFTEGPASDGQGNLWFSDIPNNRIHHVDPAGKLTTFLENSQGCNGLMLDARGRLIACQGKAGKIIAIDLSTKQITVLAEQCDGKPLKGPNDLVIDRQGGICFTDLPENNVHYVSADGKVVCLVKDVSRPNGVLLTPDEKTLIVLPSGQAEVMAYPIESPGKIGKGRVFCKLEQDPAQPKRPGGDGLAVDTRGNFYFTKPALKAIQVVSPEGKTLGMIYFPEAPANCCFGGKDMKTLYVTAQSSLYAVKMEATGHRFGTGK